ncbi:MAG TPA: hypothetical protein VJ731_02550 [Terriglobales bacterium]|nr:hypothetical protein [Terriglobales bacterium]
MADSLYLNLWFGDTELVETLAHAVSVMRQFPFSALHPGVSSVAVHPISWGEATILEQRFRPGISAEDAATIAAGLPHEDYAYVFEANWDLWTPQPPQAEWILNPSPVKFIVRGEEFEEGEAETQGDVQVDFGQDSPFLHEEMQLSPELESRVRNNVQKLVDFTTAVEKHSGAKTRLLWSESEENLAQKLVNRLQRVQ